MVPYFSYRFFKISKTERGRPEKVALLLTQLGLDVTPITSGLWVRVVTSLLLEEAASSSILSLKEESEHLP